MEEVGHRDGGGEGCVMVSAAQSIEDIYCHEKAGTREEEEGMGWCHGIHCQVWQYIGISEGSVIDA